MSDPTSLAFFTAATDGSVEPTDLARSSWSTGQVHGVAVSGLLARAAERAASGRDDLRPARLTLDLFRPARMTTSRVETQVVREGRRLCLVDVVLMQDDEPVARAGVLFLRPSATPDGELWHPSARAEPPPAEVVPPADRPRPPFLHSEAAGWSQRFGEHQNGGRKTSWSTAVPIVAGEPLTPFQAAAASADGASLVTNWGSAGVQHINTDVTLSLARLPEGTEVGLWALDRVEDDGIATGTAAMFDRAGPVGTVVVTSIANADRAIDFSSGHRQG